MKPTHGFKTADRIWRGERRGVGGGGAKRGLRVVMVSITANYSSVE